MFNKLRERLYDRKIKKNLENIELDTFAYCGDSKYPYFVIRGTKTTIHRFFTPQTDKTFKLAFSKLKNSFFKAEDLGVVKNRIREYMCYFNISEEAYVVCVKLFIQKSFLNNQFETNTLGEENV